MRAVALGRILMTCKTLWDLFPAPLPTFIFCHSDRFFLLVTCKLAVPEWGMHFHASLPFYLLLLFPEHPLTWLTPAYPSRLGFSATSPRKPSQILQVHASASIVIIITLCYSCLFTYLFTAPDSKLLELGVTSVKVY